MRSFNTDSLLMVPQLNTQKSKFKGQKKLDLDDIVAKEASSTLTDTEVYLTKVWHPTKLSENEN